MEPIDDAADQEESRFGENDMGQVKNGGGQGQLTAQADAQHQVANLADDVEGEQAAHIELGDCAKYTCDHCQGGQDENDGLDALLGGKDEGEGAQNGVHADFGEQCPKKGGDGRGWGVVGSGQPAIERENGRF